MKTKADERLENAKGNIKSALFDLNKIVVEEVSGSLDFNDIWRNKILNAHSTLISLRNDLSE